MILSFWLIIQENMTISQIGYFLEVAKYKSFNKAAANLYVAQQVVSSQVKALENELGIELFDRSNKRKISLTNTGMFLYKELAPLMEKGKHIISEAKAKNAGKELTIRIGVLAVAMTRSFILPFIRSTVLTNPKVHIEYELGMAGKLRSMLDSGEIDLALMVSENISHADKVKYEIIPGTITRPKIVMSKMYYLADRTFLSMEDIVEEPFLCLSNRVDENAQKFIEDFEYHNLKPTRIIEKSTNLDVEMGLEMCQGIAIVFEDFIEHKDKFKFFDFQPAPGNGIVEMILVWKDDKYNSVAEEILKTAAKLKG